MPDARKTLPVLREEWAHCEKCSLGQRRKSENGAFVFGEGVRRGLLLIGEGPGEQEEVHGRPFVGKSGDLLRRILEALGANDYYLTNIVACRSCSPQLDAEGKPIVFQNRRGPPRIRWKDEPPTPAQYNACRPRLEEEIYLVDPVVIVGLGGTAGKALMHRDITITKERGDAEQISIGGASWVPSLTEKLKRWYRIEQGRVIDAPVEQNQVSYYFVPTLHPAYVLRKIADRGFDSPFRQLVDDLRKAVQVYETYMEMVYGIVPAGTSGLDYRDVYEQYAASKEE